MFDPAMPFFSQVWPLLIAAVLAGLVDSMGGGGGLITVPTLLNLGVPPALLLGTNKIVSCFGSLPALYRYRRAGLLTALGGCAYTLLFLFCSIAAALGAALSQNESYLAQIGIIVPILLFCVMAFMVKRWFWDEPKRKRLLLASGAAEESPERTLARIKSPAAIGGLGLISFYDGLVGPGTGAFFMNLLEHLGVKTLSANGSTKVFNLASNLGALLFFASQGRVIWGFGLAGAFSYSVGNFLGAGIVLKKGQGIVRVVILSVTTILLGRYLYRYFGG